MKTSNFVTSALLSILQILTISAGETDFNTNIEIENEVDFSFLNESMQEKLDSLTEDKSSDAEIDSEYEMSESETVEEEEEGEETEMEEEVISSALRRKEEEEDLAEAKKA